MFDPSTRIWRCFLKHSKIEDGSCSSWIGFKLDQLATLAVLFGSLGSNPEAPQEGWDWAIWVDCDLPLGLRADLADRSCSHTAAIVVANHDAVIVAAIRMLGDVTVMKMDVVGFLGLYYVVVLYLMN
jgi:hypothetical protein